MKVEAEDRRVFREKDRWGSSSTNKQLGVKEPDQALVNQVAQRTPWTPFLISKNTKYEQQAIINDHSFVIPILRVFQSIQKRSIDYTTQRIAEWYIWTGDDSINKDKSKIKNKVSSFASRFFRKRIWKFRTYMSIYN